MSQTTQAPISPLRRRMIEDMTVRGFGEKTQSDYIRHVKNFTIFLGRSPDRPRVRICAGINSISASKACSRRR